MFADLHATMPQMLSDRPYLRNEYPKERTSFLIWLLSATIAGFIVQQIFSIWLHNTEFQRIMGLSPGVLGRQNFWSLFTYPFLHRGILHLLAIALPVFFLGRELAPVLGEKRLAWLALIAVAAGGLVWVGIHFGRGGDLLGATPILWCFLTLYACLFPNKEISFLVFFVVPVTVRPKNVAWSLLAIDLAGFFLTELPGNSFHGLNLPHSAHLAGMFVGWLGAQHFRRASALDEITRADAQGPRWMKRPKKTASNLVAALPTPPPPPANREDIRAEVDRILDKINSEGFGSLNPEEKRVLDEARELLSRR